MRDQELQNALDTAMAVLADVPAYIVTEVLSCEDGHTDEHNKFRSWVQCNKEKFFAACVLGGARDLEDMEDMYQMIVEQVK